MSTAYDKAAEYILNIPKFAGKNSLEDTARLLDILCPLRKGKIIHIAGTNGKGSVACFIHHTLRKAGIRAGLFTSPHLVSMTERIVMNDDPVSEETFTEAYESVLRAVKEAGDTLSHPSFFEFLFLMAMKVFTDEGAEYIVLETGLGGRLDATNCVREKALTVITNIDYDHTEYLGETLREIAFEKAGILREGVPVVCVDNKPEVTEVIQGRARELNSECYPIKPENITISDIFNKDYIDFSLGCDYYRLENVRITGSADYQTMNASLALVSLSLAGDPRLTEKVIREGIGTAVWTGRFTLLREGVRIDGAHNPDGIRAFLSSVRRMGDTGRNLLVFGALRDKNIPEMIRMIGQSGLFSEVYLTKVGSSRTAEPEDLRGLFASFPGIRVTCFADASRALLGAMDLRRGEDTVYVTGSLYLLGEILEADLRGALWGGAVL